MALKRNAYNLAVCYSLENQHVQNLEVGLLEN